ncbi:MAG: SDR family oxidoreductase [Bacteroidota bacterium]
MKRLRSELTPKRPVVWVTGASKGIGRAIAMEFASIGCQVCLSGRSRTLLNSAVKEIIKLGGKAISVPCDISDLKSVKAAHATIIKKAGDIDVLVNNAGITTFKPFVKTPPQEFEKIIKINLLGHIYCTKAVLPSMLRNKSGFIFNIISYAAIKTFGDSSAYTAAKAGMFGLGKVLREELREHNVKVINVLPGAVETKMWPAGVRRKYAGRMMKPESLAEVIVNIFRMPPDVVTDEIVLRPQMGDLK